MKIKILLLAMCLLTLASTGFAQKKKTTAAIGPDQVVRNLYAAQKLEKTNPFAQIKSRALVDKYFTKDLADMIWKTNSSDIGWNVDPLYNSQDPQITRFAVGKPTEDGGPDNVHVKATFQSYGKPETIGFDLRREANKTWKIDNIDYSDGEDLASMLRYTTDAEYMKDYDDDQTFKGGYIVGATRCEVTPTMNRLFYRVTCEDQDGFKLYTADGDTNETAFIYMDKGKQHGRFVFKNGENDGKFFDAAGKEMSVKRVLNPSGDEEATDDGNIPADSPADIDTELFSGTLQIGKTESVIVYVGEETGDYAAVCFTNNSAAGRTILAACKDKGECEIRATYGEGTCTVPGLEADLSSGMRIATVLSAKALAPRK